MVGTSNITPHKAYKEGEKKIKNLMDLFNSHFKAHAHTPYSFLSVESLIDVINFKNKHRLYPIHHFMLPLFYFPFLFSAQN
jgi:hypothetical protein